MNHLPEYSEFSFVEIEMRDLVSKSTFAEFRSQVEERASKRRTKERRETRYDKKVQDM